MFPSLTISFGCQSTSLAKGLVTGGLRSTKSTSPYKDSRFKIPEKFQSEFWLRAVFRDFWQSNNGRTRCLSSSCDENKRVYLLVSQQINCTSLPQAIICIACAVLFVHCLPSWPTNYLLMFYLCCLSIRKS
jgi:hypothetical protein